jgi:predicted DCC family thiol-disulfide oxidoreductase YuxK
MAAVVESGCSRQSGFESTTLEVVITQTPSRQVACVDAAPTQLPQLTVYYDGACPVCSREIAHYRQQPGAQACQWIDAAHCPSDVLGADLTRAQALDRFHVRLADGRLVDGAAGFAALWQLMPGWRWLGRLVQWAPVRPVAALAYAAFLRLRPLWRRQPPHAA